MVPDFLMVYIRRIEQKQNNGIKIIFIFDPSKIHVHVFIQTFLLLFIIYSYIFIKERSYDDYTDWKFINKCLESTAVSISYQRHLLETPFVNIDQNFYLINKIFFLLAYYKWMN